MSKDKKILLILDANALVHRSFHALPDFRTPKGELVNAVYGFTSILLRVLKEFEPEYVAAAFDVAGPTFRDEEYAEYKAKRVKAPDELYAQIPRIKEMLNAFNISVYEKEGFEADDVIGTIAALAQKKQTYPLTETIIASGDLDTLQLVDKHTKVYTMRKGLTDTVLYDEEAVRKRFGGLTSGQMVDYKGLRGDPSDNIPGVIGVGEKTAIQLLSDFGSIVNLYKEIEKDTERAKKIKPGLRAKLVQHKDQAFFSRELVTIRKDVPIDFKLEDLLWNNYDHKEVERVLRELGFKSLLARLPKTITSITSPPAPLSLTRRGGIGGGEVEVDPTYEKIEAFYSDGVLSKEVYELEKKLVPLIRGMEEAGIKIDKKHFAELAKDIAGELRDAQDAIYKIVGKKFNVNSPQQLSEILFGPSPGGLALPIKGLKKTPGGVVSTAAPELLKLQGKHSIIKELLRHRELQKLNSTYISPLPGLADKKDRVHTKFDQLGTATGRLSSSKPNMQNIPVRGDWGLKIRKGFIAEEGFKFVAFDYSQMELRLAAHIADDKKMKEFFKEGADIHKMTAAEVFAIAPDEITKDMRFRAKALNFGVLYGMGASGFAKSANIPREEAQAFIDNYFARFPSVRSYIENTIEFARHNGYVETLLGRKRYIPEITSSHAGLRAQAERMAINHPIQGSAADIIKMAMTEIHYNLKPKTYNLLLQIHDELLFEIEDDKIEETYPLIKDIMEGVYSLSVPLRVDVSYGHSWGELKVIK
ncbi:MAG: DNA polymerase [Candidatus Spechtbacterales bacterium]